MAKQKPVKSNANAPKVAKAPAWQHENFYKYWIFLFAFLLFADSIPNGYNLDDELVTINHRLTSKGISALPEIFTSPYYQDASGYSYEYRPMVLASFAIEHELSGDNAHISHFVNVFLYALCGILLYLILLRLFRGYSPFLSIAATLLFIAHPTHTEVVCSIKNRDEILGLLFSLLSFYMVFFAIQTSRRWLILFAMLSFTLALMSKVTVVSFVLIIPLALILFTDAGFPIILLVAGFFALPTFFLVNFGLGQDKVLLIFGVIAFTGFMYILVHFGFFLSAATSFSGRIYGIIFRKGVVPEHTIENPPLRFNGFFKDAIPNRKIFSSPILFLPVSLAILYLWCLHESHSLVALLPIIVLMALAMRGGASVSWWSNALLCLCIAIDFKDTPANGNIIYVDILQIYFAYLVVFGQRSLLIPYLLSFLIFNYFNIQLFYRFDGIISVFFIWLLQTRYWYLTLIIISITQVPLSFLQKEKIGIELLRFILGAGSLLYIHYYRKSGYVPIVFVLIAIFMSHYYLAPLDHSAHVRQNISRAAQAVNKINPDILPHNQYRPLQYVEECIDKNSPETLKIGTSLEIIYRYFIKVVVPYPLSFYYGYKFITPQKATDTIPIAGLIIHLALLFAAFFFLKRNKLISFGIFTYLISIAVFSNYLQPVPGMFADRFLLVPSIGWCILAVVAIQALFKIKADTSWLAIPTPARYVFFFLLFLYSSLSFARNLNWKDYLTLFEHDINYADDCAQAHNLLAVRLIKTSYADTVSPAAQLELRTKAAFHFRRAIEIYPPFFNANYDLARTYTLLGNMDSAMLYFQRTMEIDSSFTDAAMAIGDILVGQNKLHESEPYYQSLVTISPRNMEGYDKLSYVYFIEKDFSRSTGILKQAIAEMPESPQPYINLAKIYHNIKNNDSAAILLKAALKVSPGNEEAKKYLHALGQ